MYDHLVLECQQDCEWRMWGLRRKQRERVYAREKKIPCVIVHIRERVCEKKWESCEEAGVCVCWGGGGGLGDQQTW